jgi:autotransporter-associated beta strand protein
MGTFLLSFDISGVGNVGAEASSTPSPTGSYSTIEFLGTADNTFTGTLNVHLNSGSGPGVYLDKQGGSVVTNRLEIVRAAHLYWRNSHQLGDHTTVVISDGSRLDLNGYDETIGSLLLTNVSADSDASVVDTAGGSLDPVGTLTLNGGIVSSVNNLAVLPTVAGKLQLSSGIHPIQTWSPSRYEGLDLQADISGGGGFSKYGNAALLLKGTNSFAGAVSISEGVVDAYNARVFGATSAGVTLNGGSVLLRGVTIEDETLFVRGQQQINSELAGSSLQSFGASVWTGAVELDTNLVVELGDMAFMGYISGPGE